MLWILRSISVKHNHYSVVEADEIIYGNAVNQSVCVISLQIQLAEQVQHPPIDENNHPHDHVPLEPPIGLAEH